MLDGQMRCLRNPSKRCRWSPRYLEMCTNMYKVSRRAYEIFANGSVVKAPSSEYLRKISSALYDAPGSQSQRYEEIAKEVES